MITKTAIAALLTVSLFATGAVGFAAFTSTVTESVTATAGTISIAWSGPSATSSDSVAMCTAVITTGVLTVTFSNAAPGDFCTISATLTNSGSLPGTLSSNSPQTKGDFKFSDNIGISAPTIGVGGSFAYSANVTLSSSATIQGQSATFSITVTATAT